eukprot:363802-Chlamydomonas_euryale.AAC.1
MPIFQDGKFSGSGQAAGGSKADAKQHTHMSLIHGPLKQETSAPRASSLASARYGQFLQCHAVVTTMTGSCAAETLSALLNSLFHVLASTW